MKPVIVNLAHVSGDNLYCITDWKNYYIVPPYRNNSDTKTFKDIYSFCHFLIVENLVVISNKQRNKINNLIKI